MILRVDDFPCGNERGERGFDALPAFDAFCSAVRGPFALAVVVGKDYAADEELRHIQGVDGVYIAAHGIRHKPFTDTTVDEMRAMRDQLGGTVLAIPPNNNLDTAACERLRKAGFTHVCTGPETRGKWPGKDFAGLVEVPSAFYGVAAEWFKKPPMLWPTECAALHLTWEWGRANGGTGDGYAALRRFGDAVRSELVPWETVLAEGGMVNAAEAIIGGFTDTGDKPRSRTLLPILRKCGGMRRLVSVGEELRPGWDWWMRLFRGAGFTDFSILELWEPNVERLRADGGSARLYHADIRRLASIQCPEPADVVLWWHGPEHVTKGDFETAFEVIRAAFQPALVILGMPWGEHSNADSCFENQGSYHVSTWYPADLKARGWQTVTDGRKDIRGGHITAWRELGSPAALDFDAALKIVQPLTGVSALRLRALWDATREVIDRGVPGALVECGCGRGGSALMIALAARGERPLIVFDSFTGYPSPTDDDPKEAQAFTGKRNATLGEVQARFAAHGLTRAVAFMKGWFKDTLPAQAPGQIAMLHLDCDWYESVKLCLERLYPALAPGAILQVDDYGYWAGCRKAVDEYFATRGLAPNLVVLDDTGRQHRSGLPT